MFTLGKLIRDVKNYGQHMRFKSDHLSACTYVFKIQYISFITQRGPGSKCCHGNNLMGVTVPYLMYITGAKFEYQYSNIFIYIFNFGIYYSHL